MKKILLFILLNVAIGYAQLVNPVFTVSQKTFLDTSYINNNDTLNQRTFSDAKYVDKTSTQDIIGQKNFKSTVTFNDSNYYFMKLNGLVGYGDWYWGVRNFYVNTAARPDQVMRFGYNIGNNGMVVNSSDGGISIEMESYFDGNGYPAKEFHLVFQDSLSNQYRFLTSDFNMNTNKMSLGFGADSYEKSTAALGTYWQQPDVNTEYWQVAHSSVHPNNTAALKWYNADSTAFYTAPYFDSQNRWNLGNAQTIYAGSETLTLSNTNLRMSNSYALKSYNADSNLVNILYYDSDKLRLNAYQDEPIYFRGSHLYYEDSLNILTDLVNPQYPFDTTNVNIGGKYIDPNTGTVNVVFGVNLITNGTFDNWTGWSPDDWTASTPDTTNFYYENDGGKLHFISNNATGNPQVYQGSRVAGHTYGYSFTVSQIVDTFNVYVSSSTLNITQTGNYTGESLALTNDALFGIGAGSIDGCEITIDNIKVWDINGTKETPPYNVPVILDSLGNILLSGETSNYTLTAIDSAVTISLTNVLKTDTSSIDAYKIVVPEVTSYTTGLQVTFLASTANTDGVTLTVNGLSAIALLKRHDTALATGDIEAGQIVVCIYDGTNFQMISQLAQ